MGMLDSLLWSLGLRAFSFSRTKTPQQQLEEVASWPYSHNMVGPDNDRHCIVCDQRGVTAAEQCPGPEATQRARHTLEQQR